MQRAPVRDGAVAGVVAEGSGPRGPQVVLPRCPAEEVPPETRR